MPEISVNFRGERDHFEVVASGKDKEAIEALNAKVNRTFGLQLVEKKLESSGVQPLSGDSFCVIYTCTDEEQALDLTAKMQRFADSIVTPDAVENAWKDLVLPPAFNRQGLDPARQAEERKLKDSIKEAWGLFNRYFTTETLSPEAFKSLKDALVLIASEFALKLPSGEWETDKTSLLKVFSLFVSKVLNVEGLDLCGVIKKEEVLDLKGKIRSGLKTRSFNLGPIDRFREETLFIKPLEALEAKVGAPPAFPLATALGAFLKEKLGKCEEGKIPDVITKDLFDRTTGFKFVYQKGNGELLINKTSEESSMEAEVVKSLYDSTEPIDRIALLIATQTPRNLPVDPIQFLKVDLMTRGTNEMMKGKGGGWSCDSSTPPEGVSETIMVTKLDNQRLKVTSYTKSGFFITKGDRRWPILFDTVCEYTVRLNPASKDVMVEELVFNTKQAPPFLNGKDPEEAVLMSALQESYRDAVDSSKKGWMGR